MVSVDLACGRLPVAGVAAEHVLGGDLAEVSPGESRPDDLPYAGKGGPFSIARFLRAHQLRLADDLPVTPAAMLSVSEEPSPARRHDPDTEALQARVAYVPRRPGSRVLTRASVSRSVVMEYSLHPVADAGKSGRKSCQGCGSRKKNALYHVDGTEVAYRRCCGRLQ